APAQWGPGREYPLVLGPNAGGFPSVYAGTDEPVNLWLAQIHGRVVYGKLGESPFADTATQIRQRFASGLVGEIVPRGLTGLEIGGTRFIHRPWTGFPHLSVLRRPFEGFVSNNLPGSTINDTLENQVGSVFARWALPAARAEFYGEFYKEDFVGGFHV